MSRCENNRAVDWGGVSHYMMGRRSVPTHSVHGETRVCCAIVCCVGWNWGGRGESKILSNLERGAAKSFAVPLAQRAKGKGWLAFLVLLSNCVTPTERVDVVVRSGSVRKVVAR